MLLVCRLRLAAFVLLVIALPLAAAAGGADPSLPAELRGPATVIDGDRLTLQGERVRLYGIDAPEGRLGCKGADGRTWPCGKLAGEVLEKAIAGREVWCVPRERDRYSRVVAVCIAGKVELNGLMVREGWAVALHRNTDHYVAAEQEARRERRGMWDGRFEPPAEWRKAQP